MCEDCKDDPWYEGIQAFLKQYPNAEFGPGHIVFSDMNTERADIEHCLYVANMIDHFLDNHRIRASKNPEDFYELNYQVEISREELKATIEFLKRMLAALPPDPNKLSFGKLS